MNAHPLCHNDIFYPVAPSVAGPVETRWPAHPARRPSGGEPDARAVRQNGGWQHQNETLDGGDLCAFNRQRKAVVQVEVTSFSPFLPSLLLTVAKVKWFGLEQAMDHKRLHFAACWHLLLLPYHTKKLHVSFIFFNSVVPIWVNNIACLTTKFEVVVQPKLINNWNSSFFILQHENFVILDSNYTLKSYGSLEKQVRKKNLVLLIVQCKNWIIYKYINYLLP